MTQRDSQEIEALVADRYLDSLLAARERRAVDAPADATLDPDVRSTARLLEAELGRVHPSFRFEERLANELQARAAGRTRRGGPFGRVASLRRSGRGAPVQLRSPETGPDEVLPVPSGLVETDRGTRSSTLVPASLPARLDPVAGRRPLIIGGALTSAALSIAGAYVAWRHGRPPLSPMVRAVRAAHRSGLTRRVSRRGSRLALPRTGPGGS